MKINYHWLQDYVAIDHPADRLGRELTLAGLALESWEESSNGPILDFDITSNRGDCLCHVGLAREAAAIHGVPLKMPDCRVPERSGEPVPFDIEIQNPRLCRRYCGLVLEGVRVGPSPGWMQDRLLSVGQRPINNIVDSTNYVLLELGHPLHAFDLDLLNGGRIIVRTARPGEMLKTLDGTERLLTATMLVIADARHPVALAGIMGGEESEISDGTTRILLESAHFNPISIRRTARSLGLSTEASYRFERHADIENAERAIGRCARLILEIAGGRVASPLMDAYPGRKPSRRIALNPRSVERLVGAPVEQDFSAARLHALGFEVQRSSRGFWRVTVPAHRPDVTMEADLVEEVARHYGYDRIPTTHDPWRGISRLSRSQQLERFAAEILRGLGYSEVVNTSFATDQELEKFPGGDGEPVPLRNPISGEETRLRWNVLPMLLRNCRHNFNFGSRDLRLFERAKAFHRSLDGKVVERKRLALLLTGSPDLAHWSGKPREANFFDLKGEILSLLRQLQVLDAQLKPGGAPTYLNPNLSGILVSEEEPIGYLGRLAGDLEETWKLRQPVFLGDLDWEAILQKVTAGTRYQPLPKFPAVQRDISFVIEKSVQYNTIESTLKESGIRELKDFELFDLYCPKDGEESRVSLSVRLTYQGTDRTLTDEEIREFDRKIVDLLTRKLGIALRS